MTDLFAGILAILAVIVGYIPVATIGFGSILAMILSWSRNSSVFWAVIHGWLSWLYVIYYHLQRKPVSH